MGIYNKLHLTSVTSTMTPADRRAVKIWFHKDNISHYFTQFQYHPKLLQPKHCLASVSANRVINIHIFRDEMGSTLNKISHTHTHKCTHTPQREISWLLKYNYLTADCHLGRCLDRLFLSLLPPLCVCIFPYLLSLAIFSVLFFFSHQSSAFSETLLGRLHNVWCNLQVFSCCNFQRRLVRWIIKYAFVFPMK